MTVKTVGGPEAGFALEQHVCRMLAHGALSVGDIVSIDESTISTNDLIWTTTKAATDAQTNQYEVHGVVLDAASAANDVIRVGFRGVFDAQTTGTPAVGAALEVGAAVLQAATQDNKVVAICLETGTSSPTRVMFDGICGLGHKSDA